MIGASGLIVAVVAVGLEIVAGQYANSEVPAWAELVPLAWPAPARVVWWLLVATGAGAFRWSLHRLGMRPNPVVTVASVAPFVAFAGGIAMGADWATWH